MECLGDGDMWNLVSICLEIVLVLVQVRCTVCAKRTIGSTFVLNVPDVLLGDEAEMEARFGPFRDSVSVGAR